MYANRNCKINLVKVNIQYKNVKFTFKIKVLQLLRLCSEFRKQNQFSCSHDSLLLKNISGKNIDKVYHKEVGNEDNEENYMYSSEEVSECETKLEDESGSENNTNSMITNEVKQGSDEKNYADNTHRQHTTPLSKIMTMQAASCLIVMMMFLTYHQNEKYHLSCQNPATRT